jgi:Tfp pilus assembly protein PilF
MMETDAGAAARVDEREAEDVDMPDLADRPERIEHPLGDAGRAVAGRCVTPFGLGAARRLEVRPRDNPQFMRYLRQNTVAATKRMPRNSMARFHLALILHQLGDLARAHVEFQRALECAKSWLFMYMTGETIRHNPRTQAFCARITAHVIRVAVEMQGDHFATAQTLAHFGDAFRWDASCARARATPVLVTAARRPRDARARGQRACDYCGGPAAPRAARVRAPALTVAPARAPPAPRRRPPACARAPSRRRLPHIWNDLALMHLQAGECEAARVVLETVVAHWPAYVDALANLALALLGVGQTEAAVRALQATLVHSRSHVEALNNYATVLIEEQREPRLAVAVLRAALEWDATQPAVWSNLSVAYSRIGKAPEACAALARACELAPEWDAIWLNAASLIARVPAAAAVAAAATAEAALAAVASAAGPNLRGGGKGGGGGGGGGEDDGEVRARGAADGVGACVCGCVGCDALLLAGGVWDASLRGMGARCVCVCVEGARRVAQAGRRASACVQGRDGSTGECVFQAVTGRGAEALPMPARNAAHRNASRSVRTHAASRDAADRPRLRGPRPAVSRAPRRWRRARRRRRRRRRRRSARARACASSPRRSRRGSRPKPSCSPTRARGRRSRTRGCAGGRAAPPTCRTSRGRSCATTA